MNSLFWFRKSLRLHDNHALLVSITNAQTLFPVFILDKWHSDPSNIGDTRFEFMLESLRDLDRQLKEKVGLTLNPNPDPKP
jgi:deoxyribodipyrimidine photolyase